jgi:hypothetical protein
MRSILSLLAGTSDEVNLPAPTHTREFGEKPTRFIASGASGICKAFRRSKSCSGKLAADDIALARFT